MKSNVKNNRRLRASLFFRPSDRSKRSIQVGGSDHRRDLKNLDLDRLQLLDALDTRGLNRLRHRNCDRGSCRFGWMRPVSVNERSDKMVRPYRRRRRACIGSGNGATGRSGSETDW